MVGTIPTSRLTTIRTRTTAVPCAVPPARTNVKDSVRTPVSVYDLRRAGSDKFGNFHLTGGPCTHCGAERTICVNYRFNTNGIAANLPNGIKPSDTILQPRGTHVDETYLGINCGCYAKLHRQVARIQEKIEARQKFPQNS